MMEKDRPDIVEVPIEGKEAPSSLIRPDFDLVVVTTRNEEWLSLVKVDPTNRSIVLLESVNQCPHSIVP